MDHPSYRWTLSAASAGFNICQRARANPFDEAYTNGGDQADPTPEWWTLTGMGDHADDSPRWWRARLSGARTTRSNACSTGWAAIHSSTRCADDVRAASRKGLH